jgi:hypothetical protein
MAMVPSLKWWHAAATSFVVAATLMLLVHRAFLPSAESPSLLRIVASPPLDLGLAWYPTLAAVPLVVACVRRSIQLVVAIQLGLVLAGFLHVMWIVGTVPGKLDLRLVLVAFTGHAVAWTSYLCVVGALTIGFRGERPR